jgi:SAM-dependent methyltransferase
MQSTKLSTNVIQFVVSGPVPRLRGLRARCVSDPDRLLRIARRAAPLKARESDEFSLILHDLRMGGAWKRTNPGRLRRTEEILCRHVPPQLRTGVVFLDLGASDGITTVEAVRAMRQAWGQEVRALLADVNLDLLRYRLGPVVEYRAADGEPVMVRAGRLGLRLARSRRTVEPDDNRLARLYLRLRRFRGSMRLDAPISLVHPLAHREPGITIRELDCLVFDPRLEDQVVAIRASNVLNLGYFDAAQLRCAAEHLHRYLRQGGCLVVSRNQDRSGGETENGSVWLKDGPGFRWVADFGAGSEIKPVIDHLHRA